MKDFDRDYDTLEISDLFPELGELTDINTETSTQIELERLHCKYQQIPAMKADFARDLTEVIEETGLPMAFCLALLVQMALHRTADVSTMVGILRPHFEDHEHPAQACADAIWEACGHDLLDYDDQRQLLVMVYDVDDETHRMIEQFMYPLPMVEKPSQVLTNKGTGYKTIKGSIILKNNHIEEDVCLDHINRMNAQELKLNTKIVSIMQNSWANLDKRQEDETVLEFRARQRAFKKFDRTSRDVIDLVSMQSEKFWLTHKYDKRGRTYAQGYHINYQSGDWHKAMIEFFHTEPLKEI